MEDNVRYLIEQYYEAERTNDITVLRELLHEDFQGIGPLGFVLPKKTWLERHESGDLRYEFVKVEEVTIRAYQSVALAVTRVNQVASAQGRQVQAELRSSLTFLKTGGGWKLLGVHMCAIDQPPKFSNSKQEK